MSDEVMKWSSVRVPVPRVFRPTASVFERFIDDVTWQLTKPSLLFASLLNDPADVVEFDNRLAEWEALDWERTQRLIREGARSYGPHLFQCMPLELDPNNLWYWLPEEYEECECR